MSGLVVLLALLATVFIPIIFIGMLMLPGIDDALAGTTVNRPAARFLLFFYLLGFRVAPLLRVFA
ncbi:MULTISPECIES: hypothetical protein [unclassified Cryobacterium]|uniref:hypothetical protein n=1 Tax=unclassified Cryobacterium TaxID=2649013 RepID=UPI00106CDAF7|nr:MULTISPECIES: hypothetical protein [unclassified Cryobacterium]TFC59465.1 hypothetical protein E3O68_00775 [Cryobacterium sp. TMB3-1-2]TFC67261.1 hypothetical protein E3T21_17470 [Cryobacterium sp. TMB3-15]TFC73226.1 hypothetical protein E3T22_16585 [Cryobacterium sp. TMB3-10]TFD46114.1 hypothetical protein E3T58_01220 [Cryobacterium sp. TMB3-12]